MAQKVLVKGSTYRFRFTITKDGDPWDLTDATVTLYVLKPDGTAPDDSPFDCEALDPPEGGVAQFQNDAALFDAAELWTLAVQVAEGDVLMRSDPITVLVVESP